MITKWFRVTFTPNVNVNFYCVDQVFPLTVVTVYDFGQFCPYELSWTVSIVLLAFYFEKFLTWISLIFYLTDETSPLVLVCCSVDGDVIGRQWCQHMFEWLRYQPLQLLVRRNMLRRSWMWLLPGQFNSLHGQLQEKEGILWRVFQK